MRLSRQNHATTVGVDVGAPHLLDGGRDSQGRRAPGVLVGRRSASSPAEIGGDLFYRLAHGIGFNGEHGLARVLPDIDHGGATLPEGEADVKPVQPGPVAEMPVSGYRRTRSDTATCALSPSAAPRRPYVESRRGRGNPCAEKALGRGPQAHSRSRLCGGRIGRGDLSGRSSTTWRPRGDEALAEYARKLDKVDISPDKLRVTEQEIKAAYDLVDRKVVGPSRRSRETSAASTRLNFLRGCGRWRSSRADRRTDLHPPPEGGLLRAGRPRRFPSSVMMSVIPAKVAGVPEVVVCTPPMADGRINPGVLVACDIAGADKVFRVSGAQSIAAMALGTRSVPKVDKVTGPGSKWVLAAFRLLQGEVAVGTQAGPGEGLILADETANPEFVAADMIIQAEHGTDSTGVLVTDSRPLAEAVQRCIGRHIEALDQTHRDFVLESLRKYGAIIVTDTHEEALELPTSTPWSTWRPRPAT